MNLSEKGINFIIDAETGGKSYYEKYLLHPTLPPEESGITIGCGVDLRFNTLVEFTESWEKHLSDEDFTKLARCLGANHNQAQNLLPQVRSIIIPWETAIAVFKETTLPKFYNIMLSVYPGADQLCPDCTSALTSLIFNRGASLNGSRRVEMKNIVDCVANKDYSCIMSNIINMQRLWPDCEGLRIRRQKEADLVKGCIV